MFRFLALAVAEAALLAAAFGLGRGMATPALQQPVAVTHQSAQAGSLAPQPCAVSGDLVGDANPADVARSLCGR